MIIFGIVSSLFFIYYFVISINQSNNNIYKNIDKKCSICDDSDSISNNSGSDSGTDSGSDSDDDIENLCKTMILLNQKITDLSSDMLKLSSILTDLSKTNLLSPKIETKYTYIDTDTEHLISTIPSPPPL